MQTMLSLSLSLSLSHKLSLSLSLSLSHEVVTMLKPTTQTWKQTKWRAKFR